MNFFLWLVIFIYSFYVALESISVFGRYGGFISGSITVGVSIHNQILSINRLLGFLIAPMVGLYADFGGDSGGVFLIGVVGSFIGGALLIFVYFMWNPLTILFSNMSSSFVSNGYGYKGFKLGFKLGFQSKLNISLPGLKGLKINYFFAQVFTTGLAMPSIFILNMLAIKNPEYGSTLVQSSAAISGVGNLVLNFYTMPLLSVEEARESKEIEDVYRSIFLGKVFGVLVLSPVLLIMVFFL